LFFDCLGITTPPTFFQSKNDAQPSFSDPCFKGDFDMSESRFEEDCVFIFAELPWFRRILVVS
jgi:hypothetical protein